MQELIHTSAPKGLFDTRGGYTTVACTRGMPKGMIEALEDASAIAVPHSPPGQDAGNAAVVRIWPVPSQAAPAVAVTRVVPVASDYTGRPARLAHHVILREDEATSAGLAALLLAQGVFTDTFQGTPRILEPRAVPAAPSDEALADSLAQLARLTSDEGNWARYLASESAHLRASPLRLRLPSDTAVQKVLAAIAAHAERPCTLRIATTAGGDAPAASLILAKAGSAGEPPADLDWSRTRNSSPCPAVHAKARPTAVTAPRATGPAAAAPRIDLSSLRPPEAASRNAAPHEATKKAAPATKPSAARGTSNTEPPAAVTAERRGTPWMLLGVLGISIIAAAALCFLLLF